MDDVTNEKFPVSTKKISQGPTAGLLIVHKLTQDVYWVEGGVGNCGFIIGETGVIVIDTTVSPASGKDLLNKIGEVNPNPVTTVILTHADIDHIGGLSAFPLGITIIAHSYNYDKMKLEIAAGNERFSSHHLPNRILDKHKEFMRLEGIALELLYWAPAHTAGDLAVFLPEHKVVFTGDIFAMDQPVALIHRKQQGTSAGWLKTAKGILALPAELFVVGHGQVQSRAVLQERVNRAESLRNEIIGLFNQGLTLLQVQEIVADPPPTQISQKPGGPHFSPFSEVVYQEMIEGIS